MENNRPITSVSEAPTPQTSEIHQDQPQPTGENSHTKFTLFIAISCVLVIAAACYFLFTNKQAANDTAQSSSNDSQNQKTLDASVSEQAQANDTKEPDNPNELNTTEQTPAKRLDAAADDEKRIFTAIFSNDNSDETFIFNYPEEIISIETTVNKQVYPYMGYEIIKIVTSTTEYSSQTICGQSQIRFGGIHRIPSEDREEYITNNEQNKFLLESDGYVYYTVAEGTIWGGLTLGDSCDMNKAQEAANLVSKLWQNANFK